MDRQVCGIESGRLHGGCRARPFEPHETLNRAPRPPWEDSQPTRSSRNIR
jgi:hypothetical protein